MPQETKAMPQNPDEMEHAPGFVHEKLEGLVPAMATEEEVRQACWRRRLIIGGCDDHEKGWHDCRGVYLRSSHWADAGRFDGAPISQGQG